jgi:hypothetical protein
VTFSANDNFKRLVIIVLANFTCSHTEFLRARWGSRRCTFSVANGIQRPNRRHLRAARKISLRNSGPAVSVPGPFVTLTLQREAKEQRVFRQ